MSRSVGRYLVELMVANGIDTVFGIPGVHNLELYRGLASADIRHVLVRHEQGAGFAADGYARLSGRPAAAFTISGPGLTNILTAAAQAYSDSVPLLVVATTPVRASLGKQWGVLHELQNQWALAAGVFGVARIGRERRRCARSSAACAWPRCTPGALGRRTWKSRSTCWPSHDSSRRTASRKRASLPQAAAAQIEAAARLLVDRRAAHRHRGRRRAPRGPGIAPPGRDAGLPAGDDGGGQGRAAPKAIRRTSAPRCPTAPTQALIADADVVLAVGTELGETDIYFALQACR